MVDDLAASGAHSGSKLHLLTDRLERIDRFMASGQVAAAQARSCRPSATRSQGLSPRWLSDDAADALTVEAAAR